MWSIIQLARCVSIIVGSTVLAGCAADTIRTRHVSRPAARHANDNVAKADQDAVYRKCQQRHLEYQAGKVPWDAKNLSQKKGDDQLCELAYKARR